MELRPTLSTGISDEDRFPGVFSLAQTDAMGLGDDATLELQKLVLEAEAAGNAVVDIPPGDFVLSGAIHIATGGVHLRGAGSGRTTIRARDGLPLVNISVFNRNPPALFVIGTDEGGVGTDADDVTITGMTLDGNLGAYTDDVILGNEIVHGIAVLAGNRLTFRDLVFKDTPRTALSFPQTVASAHEDVVIEHCRFFDSGQYSIEMRTVTRAAIRYCHFERSGDHSVFFADKSQDTSLGGCVDCEMSFCTASRADPPTRIFGLLAENGHFINIGNQTNGLLILGNTFSDNRNALSDGIGISVLVGSLPTNCRIEANTIELAGGFGIDCGNNFTVVGNTIVRPGSHGIFFGLDFGGTLDGVVISGNLLVDCGEAGGAVFAGISFGGGTPGSKCISTNSTVTGNTVHDTLGQCDHGLRVAPNHDVDGLSVSGNNFEDVLSESLIFVSPSVVTNLRIGENRFKAGEWYGALDLVAGTVNTATLPMPTGVTVVARVSRLDKLTSTGIGSLEALSVPATPRITITALTAAAATETNDVSRVLWHCDGTDDAF